MLVTLHVELFSCFLLSSGVSVTLIRSWSLLSVATPVLDIDTDIDANL